MPVKSGQQGGFPLEPVKKEAWIAETESIDHLTKETLEALQKNKLNRMLSTLRNKGGSPPCPARAEIWVSSAPCPSRPPICCGRHPTGSLPAPNPL